MEAVRVLAKPPAPGMGHAMYAACVFVAHTGLEAIADFPCWIPLRKMSKLRPGLPLSHGRAKVVQAAAESLWQGSVEEVLAFALQAFSALTVRTNDVLMIVLVTAAAMAESASVRVHGWANSASSMT